MRFVSTGARYLLGLLFTVMGLNGFLHFLPMAPVPPLAGQFVGALIQSHYMAVVFALELTAGLLLLATSYVPLGLALLAPIVVNIDLFHLLLAPEGLILAALVSLLWLVVAYRFREAFLPLFRPVRSAAKRETASQVPSSVAA